MTVHDVVYGFVSAFLALFPVMNPVGSGFIVNGFLKDLDDTQRKSAIKKIVVYCMLIALGSLVAGHLILLLFGLAVPVIQVGGGIIICMTGWNWLSDRADDVAANTRETVKKIDVDGITKKLFYPISFPVTVGPGTISVIFTLMATASVDGNFLHTGINYAIIAVAIAALIAILYLFLSQGHRVMRKLGDSGTMIINKLIAFITFCIGLQITFTGISKVFNISIL